MKIKERDFTEMCTDKGDLRGMQINFETLYTQVYVPI